MENNILINGTWLDKEDYICEKIFTEKLTKREVIEKYGDYLTDFQKNELMNRVLKEPNTVFCSINSPEVQEFIELSSVKVETDGIEEQKLTKSKWDSLI